MQYSKAPCIIYEYVLCSLACLSWSNVKVNALFICCWVTCFSHPLSLSFCLNHRFPLSRKQSELVSAPLSSLVDLSKINIHQVLGLTHIAITFLLKCKIGLLIEGFLSQMVLEVCKIITFRPLGFFVTLMVLKIILYTSNWSLPF